MSTAMDIKRAILNLIGHGLSDATLRASLKQGSTSSGADGIDEALQDLQHTGEIIGAGGIWLPGHVELVECPNPEIMERLLDPGEFVEVDFDQLMAELEAMLAEARSR